MLYIAGVEFVLHQMIDRVFSGYPVFKFKKGEIIFRPGDTPFNVFQIRTGYVRLYSISESGEELTLLLLKPNDFFPFRWAIGDFPMKYTLAAFTAVTASKIPKGDFLGVLETNNKILFEFTKRLVVRVSTLYDRMDELVFGTSRTKVKSILQMCAETYGKEIGKGIEIQMPLTHADIANLVGLSRETVSIELKKMERYGDITICQHLITLVRKPN